MQPDHYTINIATRTDKPLDGFGPHYVHEMEVKLPSAGLQEACAKMRELQALQPPTHPGEAPYRKFTLTKWETRGIQYSDAELRACELMGRWPS